MKKKYWYYACTYSLNNGGLAGSCGVTFVVGNGGFFPVTNTQSKAKKQLGAITLVITFFHEISKADYHEFVRNTQKT